jgi:hypothetical protein
LSRFAYPRLSTVLYGKVKLERCNSRTRPTGSTGTATRRFSGKENGTGSQQGIIAGNVAWIW